MDDRVEPGVTAGGCDTVRSSSTGRGGLYESTPGATYKSIADLGLNRATLREWVLRDRDRRGVAATAPAAGGMPAARAGQTASSAGPDERIRQPKARVAELEASERKLATERDILRKAAEYFTGETNW
ncbi:hypothetical protein [Streptomyces sp. NWU339]|uniref:hypothetical protein n=1 Tax=Streptomyces sp. NWU339 TaxID=2185284 RepID=UPI00215A0E0E|nr:hypothetical protein [Streptomyces sp. NWU339]